MWEGPKGGACAGGSESSAPPGARLVAEAHQWTLLGGKLAPGAVRGRRRGSWARGLGTPQACEASHLPFSAAARSAEVLQRPPGSGAKNGYACTLSQEHCVAP